MRVQHVCLAASIAYSEVSCSVLVSLATDAANHQLIITTACCARRTDFQEGSSTKLYESVWSQLFSLPLDTTVYPAHDYKGRCSSTIGEVGDAPAVEYCMCSTSLLALLLLYYDTKEILLY
jgi:hypothetical protein